MERAFGLLWSGDFCLGVSRIDKVESVVKTNIPKHVGFIPDGNRRWAISHGSAERGWLCARCESWLLLFEKCKAYGISEVSVYGFTQDSTRRDTVQTIAFREACFKFAFEVARRSAALLVVGRGGGGETSVHFPDALKEFRQRRGSE
ncbi:MAG: undecaprenyl diphosphate synthase family protein [Acidiferrobacteraceae bacterium]